MPEYDFHQLSPLDLEVLVRDLLQAEWGVPIESFKSGRDRGIDLRHAVGPQSTIIQVKHYLKTGIRGLIRDLKKEKPKVDKLNPTRYVVATSVPLSPDDKDAIVQIFGAHRLAFDDVMGQEKLNALLGQHDEVEKRHFKLWLASKAVLERVLHNAEFTKSEFKVAQVYQEAKRYVANDAFPSALKMLDEHRVVIVAGPPGVGKTTLADLLLYKFLESGYQAVLIQKGIEDGEKLFQKGKSQVFYFDDFMGATFLGDRPAGMTAVHDQALINFIAMVRANPKARLILTTREHIYSYAKSRSERLRNSDLDDLRVMLHMPSYSRTQRARILYNHLYFSDLPDEYIDELLRGGFYFQIVKHERFNPRLIEWLSTYRRIRTVPVDKYQKFVLSLLQDPYEIWEHAYKEELTDAGRSLLLALHSFGGKAGGDRLRAVFAKVHAVRSERYGFQSRPEDFQIATNEAANVFIKPWGTNGVEVLDPSVLDLMNAVVRKAPENGVDVMAAAISFEQIEHFWALAKSDKGASVLNILRDNADRLAPAIQVLALKERRHALPEGGATYSGSTYERRAAMVAEMAHRLSSSALAVAVPAIVAKLKKVLETEYSSIADAADLVRTLSISAIVPNASKMADAVRKVMLDEAKSGCHAEELRELITVVDTSKTATAEAAALRIAFDKFRATHFAEDLLECRNGGQYSGLVKDLEFFRDELKVNVDDLIEEVEEAAAEYDEYQELYADSKQDEWKEAAFNERQSDREMSEMFGSLGDDRD